MTVIAWMIELVHPKAETALSVTENIPDVAYRWVVLGVVLSGLLSPKFHE